MEVLDSDRQYHQYLQGFRRQQQAAGHPVYQRNYDWGTKHCARFLRRSHRNHPRRSAYALLRCHRRQLRDCLHLRRHRRTTASDDHQPPHAGAGAVLGKRCRHVQRRAAGIEDPKRAIWSSRTRMTRSSSSSNRSRTTTMRTFGAAARGHTYRILDHHGQLPLFSDRIARDELDGDEIWDAICRLQVMLLDLEPQDDPQRIFESINSTGLELSEADKIRNVVLMGAEKPCPGGSVRELLEPDREIRRISDRLVHPSLFRPPKPDKHHAWTGSTRRFVPSRRPLRSDARNSGRDAQLRRIREKAQWRFHRRHRRRSSPSPLQHDQARCDASSDDASGREVEAETVSQTDFAAVVQILDSYVFRRFVCGVPTNALNKIFATAYTEVRRLRSAQDSFSDVLTYSLTDAELPPKISRGSRVRRVFRHP